MTKIILQDVEQQIIDYYLADHSLRDTENVFQIDRHAISKFLKVKGLLRDKVASSIVSWKNSKKQNINNISQELKDEIIYLYINGHPKSAIQEKLNVSRTIVSFVLENQPKVVVVKKKKSSSYYAFSQEEELRIITYYLVPHSLKETAKYFNCKSNNPIYRVLLKNNIALHTTDISRALAKVSTIKTCLKKYDVVNPGCIPSVIEKRIQTCKTRYGENSYMQTAEFREKTAKTNIEKYGVNNYLQSNMYKKASRKHYTYSDGEHFDSSWELALWIYAKDHDEEIEHESIRFSFTVNNTIHYYTPDFIYNGSIIEIKGDHLVENGKLIDFYNNYNTELLQAKNNIIELNNIKLWVKSDIKFAINYVTKTYGKQYLKQFKNI